MLGKFCEMAGLPDRSLKLDIGTCDSEMESAHRNYALLHYMKSMGVRIALFSEVEFNNFSHLISRAGFSRGS